MSFYVAVKALAGTAYSHGFGLIDEEELPEGWQDDAAAKLSRLEFYADCRVAAAASAAPCGTTRGAGSSRDCHREAAQQAIAALSHAASASQRHQPPKAPSGQHSTAPVNSRLTSKRADGSGG